GQRRGGFEPAAQEEIKLPGLVLGVRESKGEGYAQDLCACRCRPRDGRILGFTAAAASADRDGAPTSTPHFTNATATFAHCVPCRDFEATITITYNGVFHVTVNKAGDFCATER